MQVSENCDMTSTQESLDTHGRMTNYIASHTVHNSNRLYRGRRLSQIYLKFARTPHRLDAKMGFLVDFLEVTSGGETLTRMPDHIYARTDLIVWL